MSTESVTIAEYRVVNSHGVKGVVYHEKEVHHWKRFNGQTESEDGLHSFELYHPDLSHGRRIGISDIAFGKHFVDAYGERWIIESSSVK